jgi:hypothetical protein
VRSVHSEEAGREDQHEIGSRSDRRLVAGKYQVQPLRRVYIPKENGKQRPISIPSLEDKIVQKAVVELMMAQNRLHGRYMKLMAAGKDQRKTMTAIGRELLGFIWAIGIKAESAFTQQLAA